MKNIEIYLNEAEYSLKAKRYVYAAKCFNYVAKCFLDINKHEQAANCFVRGAKIWEKVWNFYDAAAMYFRAASVSKQHLHFVIDAIACFWNAIIDFIHTNNYFKAGLCAKYISSCYRMLNENGSVEKNLALAADFFVKSGMNYLKLKAYEKAVLSFEYAVMCYESLGLTLELQQIKNKIYVCKHNVCTSESLLANKSRSLTTDATFAPSINAFLTNNV